MQVIDLLWLLVITNTYTIKTFGVEVFQFKDSFPESFVEDLSRDDEFCMITINLQLIDGKLERNLKCFCIYFHQTLEKYKWKHVCSDHFWAHNLFDLSSLFVMNEGILCFKMYLCLLCSYLKLRCVFSCHPPHKYNVLMKTAENPWLMNH